MGWSVKLIVNGDDFGRAPAVNDAIARAHCAGVLTSASLMVTGQAWQESVKMARQMRKPILGVIENMSYLYVPEIDKKIELFGKSRGEEMAQAADALLLGQLPIDPGLAKLCDEGNIERYDSEIYDAFTSELTETLAQQRPGIS